MDILAKVVGTLAVPGAWTPPPGPANGRSYAIGGGNGMFQMLVFVAVPILALVAIRFLLKAAGLADITKFSQLMSFMNAAVATSAGDKDAKDLNGRLTSKTGRDPVTGKKRTDLPSGLGRVDAVLGGVRERVTGKVGGKAKAAGTKAGLATWDKVDSWTVGRKEAKERKERGGGPNERVADRIAKISAHRDKVGQWVDRMGELGQGRDVLAAQQALRDYALASGVTDLAALEGIVHGGALALARGEVGLDGALAIGVATAANRGRLVGMLDGRSEAEVRAAGGVLNGRVSPDALTSAVAPLSVDGLPIQVNAKGRLVPSRNEILAQLDTSGLTGVELHTAKAVALHSSLDARLGLVAGTSGIRLSTPELRAAAAGTIAAGAGVPEGSVVMGTTGNYAIASAQRVDGRRQLADLPVAALGRPWLYMDVAKEPGMDEDLWVETANARLRASGWMDEGGAERDVLRSLGYDIRKDADRKKVEQWQAGRSVPADDKKRLDMLLTMEIRPPKELAAQADAVALARYAQQEEASIQAAVNRITTLATTLDVSSRSYQAIQEQTTAPLTGELVAALGRIVELRAAAGDREFTSEERAELVSYDEVAGRLAESLRAQADQQEAFWMASAAADGTEFDAEDYRRKLDGAVTEMLRQVETSAVQACTAATTRQADRAEAKVAEAISAVQGLVDATAQTCEQIRARSQELTLMAPDPQDLMRSRAVAPGSGDVPSAHAIIREYAYSGG